MSYPFDQLTALASANLSVVRSFGTAGLRI